MGRQWLVLLRRIVRCAARFYLGRAAHNLLDREAPADARRGFFVVGSGPTRSPAARLTPQ